MPKKKEQSAAVEPIVKRRGYAVQSNKGFICVNGETMPAIFNLRDRAITYRDELEPHIGKGKVVKVEIQVFII